MRVNGRSKRDHHDVWWGLLSISKIGDTVLVWRKPEKPKLHQQEKVTFWCGVSKLGTVGPYYFFKMKRSRWILLIHSDMWTWLKNLLSHSLNNTITTWTSIILRASIIIPTYFPVWFYKPEKGAFSLVFTSLTTQQDNLLFLIFYWMMQ